MAHGLATRSLRAALSAGRTRRHDFRGGGVRDTPRCTGIGQRRRIDRSADQGLCRGRDGFTERTTCPVWRSRLSGPGGGTCGASALVVRRRLGGLSAVNVGRNQPVWDASSAGNASTAHLTGRFPVGRSSIHSLIPRSPLPVSLSRTHGPGRGTRAPRRVACPGAV